MSDIDLTTQTNDMSQASLPPQHMGLSLLLQYRVFQKRTHKV